MKDWDYYRVPNEEYCSYEQEQEILKQLIEEINNTPLTALEREKRLKDVKRIVREKVAEIEAPAKEKQAKLTEEFWQDARDDLGYSDWLTPEGQSKLESKAYEEGHSSGYLEVYYKLTELSDFLSDMKNHFITT